MTSAHEVARTLQEAERSARAIAPIANADAPLSIADAYAIQLAGRALRVGEGERLVGHKVGLTSAAMQEMLGVDQPDFGYLTDGMVSESGCRLPADRFIAPRVELEVAFRIGATLTGGALTVDEVLAATEAVAPAIEVIDSRIADWRIGIVDTIADNASSGHVVVGAWRPLGDLDLAAVEAELVVVDADGTTTRVEGRGDAVLGHPAVAIAWLARALETYGGGAIDAGTILIPGAMARALPVRPGCAATGTVGDLGEVAVSFTAAEESGGRHG